MKKKYITAVLSFFLVFIPYLLHGAEVDVNGFFTHSVAIDLPPGTNGLAPKLSLDYNSGSGNGIVGLGWSLNGIPSITRDTTNGIKYDGTDSFVGSSGRLKLQSDGTYHYEYENYSRVQRVGGSNGNPAYWIETRADGTKYFYGNYGEISTASVQAIGKNGFIRVWALSRVEDINGNYYTVDYEVVDGEYYPQRIIYTFGNGISKKRVVDFEYEDRSDFCTQYTYSAAVTTKKRLKKIEVMVNVPQFYKWMITIVADTIKKYELEYDPQTGGIDLSRLVKLTEYGTNGNCIDTLTFTWKYDESFLNDEWDGHGYMERYAWVDLNGDGKADYVTSDKYGNHYVSLSTGTGYINQIWAGHGYMPRYAWVDLNGDGKADYVTSASDGNHYVSLSTGSGYVNQIWTGHGYMPRYAWVDLNGDGKADYVTSDKYGNHYVSLSTGTGYINQIWAGHGYMDRYAWVDLNGDGKADYVTSASDRKHYVSLSTGSGYVNQIWNGHGYADRYAWVDLNGDGKADYVTSNKYGKHYVSLSTGSGYVNQPVDQPWEGHGYADRYAWVDLNGDGKADYVTSDKDGNHYVSLSTGSGYKNDVWQGHGFDISVFSTDNLNNIDQKMFRYEWVDLDGDGKAEYVTSANEGKHYISFYNKKFDNRKIIKIRNLNGTIFDIVYNQVSKLPNAIKPDGNQYPYLANSSPRELVKSITVSDGRGASYSKTYDYLNGMILAGYPQNRQNLYFESIVETDTAKGIVTTTYYNQKPWYAGSPIAVMVKTTGGQTIKTEDYNYNTSTTTIYTGTRFIKLDSVETTNYESGVAAYTQSKSFVYDSYGNTTNITDYSVGTGTVSTSIAYDYNTSDWILNRPKLITTSSGGKIIERKAFAYLDDKIASTSVYLDSSNTWLTTSYTTDSCGNITSVKDPMGRTTTLTYDSSYNSFIAKVTNPLGHTVKMTYDSNGNVLTKTDQNGNTLINYYDGTGRLISVINSEGDTVKEIDYHDELRGNPNAQYIETRVMDDSVTGYSWSKSYYDGLGREYKNLSSAGTINSLPAVQVILTKYNSAGLVASKTIPYINGKQTPQYLYYTYDAAGKIIKESFPDGTVISTAYAASTNGILVTKTDGKGIISSAIYDSRGRLIRKTETEGARVLYGYDGSGKLVSTTDAGNYKTLITYDTLGRKTSIIDPNTGETSYDYDNAGNLTSKTDAIGNTVYYTYDKQNRLIKTDYPDSTPDVTYKYDETSSANGKGRLTSVTAGKSVFQYAYDRSGNPEYLKQTIENTSYIFTMEYDILNRMTSIIYPDGSKIDRNYSDRGFLKSVKLGSDTFVEYDINHDGTGDLKNTIIRKTGNGVKTVTAYNAANMRAIQVVSNDKNNTLLEQNKYIYDKNGNITTITNLFDSKKSQTFVYDTLNRLKTATGVYGTQNFAYSASGNLIKNSHGTMTYGNSVHPYAVTADGEGNSYSYDANGNMLSGRNRYMFYDAENRLISLRKDGTELQKNTYDHAGSRIIQQKSDGTIIYSINGLYEVVKAPNKPDQFTKFIYGNDGDLVSQVTTTGASTAGMDVITGYITDKGYGGNPVAAFFAKGYLKADRFFRSAKNTLHLQYALMILMIASFAGALIKSLFRHGLKPIQGYMRPVWSAAVSLILVISMIGSISFAGTAEAATTGSGTDGIPAIGTYYFHHDHVGSVGYVTDSAGAVTTRIDYTPYGEKTVTGPNIFHQKYTSQVDDEDTGLMYYNARYYDVKIGRFITADTVIPDSGFSQSFNRYMYVIGNPINFNDPTGHWWGKSKWKKIGRDIIGAITPYYAYKNGGKLGALLWFTGGALSYSKDEGFGITIGLNIPIPGTPFSISLGVHWQQKGFNHGWSVYAGVGYRQGNYMAGGFVSYNFNTKNTTIGVYAGYSTKYGAATIGYSVTFNKDGDIITYGVMGSGGNFLLQQNFLQFNLNIEQGDLYYTKTEEEGLQELIDMREEADTPWCDDDYIIDSGDHYRECVDNFPAPHIQEYNYSLSISSNIPNTISPTIYRGQWCWDKN